MAVAESLTKPPPPPPRIPHGSVDLLVLPEMALTGYMFKSRSEIEPYLEVAAGSKDDGPSLALYCELATRIGCWVLGGFAERQKPTGSADGAGSASTPQDSETAFNSALLVSPSGDVAGTYRKTFLYDTDKTWAKEGAGFGMWELPPPIGRLVVGICMGEWREPPSIACGLISGSRSQPARLYRAVGRVRARKICSGAASGRDRDAYELVGAGSAAH